MDAEKTDPNDEPVEAVVVEPVEPICFKVENIAVKGGLTSYGDKQRTETIARCNVVNDSYAYLSNPSGGVLAAADAVNIVAAAAPVGAVWTRLYDRNLPAEYEASWFLDTAGSDANDGLTALTPLKTVAELANRLRGATLRQNVTVGVLDPVSRQRHQFCRRHHRSTLADSGRRSRHERGRATIHADLDRASIHRQATHPMYNQLCRRYRQLDVPRNCVFTGTVQTATVGSLVNQNNSCCFDGAFLQLIDGQWDYGSGAPNNDIQWVDGTTANGLEINPGASLQGHGGTTNAWGLNNAYTGVFARLFAFGVWTYATKPSVPGGTGNDANVGGTVKLWAAIPFQQVEGNGGSAAIITL